MTGEDSQSDAFKKLLQHRLADLKNQLAAAERHYAELTGGQLPRGELRYAHLHNPSDAMVEALKHLGNPTEPIDLLKELEVGTYGFDPNDSQTARLTNMSRAYKLGGKKRIELVEGKYQLSESSR